MRCRPGLVSLAASVVLAAPSAAWTASAWDEAVNGDLSNSGLAPTQLTFGVGSNTVTGTTGNANQGERDYFSFVIQPGRQLDAIVVLPGTFVSGTVSFMGIQAGPQVTGMSAANLLGFAHYGNDSVGQDILPQVIGAPLGPGTYAVWLQETGGIIDYGFDFQVVQTAADVPVPAVAIAVLGALLGLAGLRRLRSTAA
jgi:hypothetical protein